ncbi:MAG: filamentous hemagglutinin N-terminal domain-containing protein [Elainellaceae cyanobacterium]
MGVGLSGAIALSLSYAPHATAQITPDATLGAEGSVVAEDVLVQGAIADLIEGGAIRDANLFHSFLEFNIDEGQRVYFDNPDAIANIFSRVTGNDPSNILGTLGTTGNADLYFMNPNGIVFGPNASLDVQGSFAAVTSDAIEFGEEGFFSAIDPDVPSDLLTVDPSAFFFNQIPAGNIAIQSTGGFAIPTGQNLTILGGDVLLNGGQINLLGVNVFMGGLAEAGQVPIDADGYPNVSEGVERSDVAFVGGSVSIADGGSFRSQANDFLLSNSSLITGALSDVDAGDIEIQANSIDLSNDSNISSIGLDFSTGSSGTITLDAQTLNLENDASISSFTQNLANGGALTIRAAESVRLFNGATISTGSFGSGASGDIVIETERLSLNSPGTALSQIAFINSTAFAEGDSGSIRIRARDTVELTGSRSSISSSDDVEESASGNLGGITIDTQSLTISNGAQISGNVYGSGRGGSITIRATDTVRISNGEGAGVSPLELTSSGVGSTAFGVGAGGSISIETGRLIIESDGILGRGASILSGTSGSGSSGSVSIRAEQSVELDNGSIFATTSSVGRGGDIGIETRRLRMFNNATISTATGSNDSIAEGDAGNIFIRAADSVELIGQSSVESLNIPNITSRTAFDSQGNGGDITVETGRLSIQNGGSISTDNILSAGDAGNLTIAANDIELSGWQSAPEGLASQSQLSSTVSGTRRGARGGTLTIDAERLTLRDGALIQVSTIGDPNTSSFGIAGDLVIRATDLVHIDGSTGPLSLAGNQFSSGLFAELQNTTGQGGSITINTDELSLRNGALISASTFATGDAGDIFVRVKQVTIGGLSNDNQQSGISTVVNEDVIGQSGNVDIRADRVILRQGGVISSASFGQGDAGNLTIQARDILLNGGTLAAQILETATGDGGTIQIQSDRLTLQNGGQISTSTLGEGNAGDLTIRASSIRLLGFPGDIAGGIFTTVERGATGNAGDQTIQTDRLIIRDGGAILTSTQGNGRAGNLTIRASDIQISGVGDLSRNPDDQGLSGLFAVVDSFGTDRGGNIRVRTDRLTIRDGAAISTATAGQGRAGNIQIEAQESIVLEGTDQSSEASSGVFARNRTTAGGRAGNINLTTRDFIIRDGASVNAETSNAFRGGDIVIHADTFEATSGAQVTTGTFGQGNAGDIQLRVSDSISLSNSSISSEVGEGATGSGGDITLRSGELTLSDNSLISAQSLRTPGTPAPDLLQASATDTSRGNAGNILIVIDNILILDNSDITTQAEAFAGGAINIQAEDIRLFGDADITTFVNSGAAGGGNISLTADSIIAFDDSDILAFSADGRGGNVTLDTPAFFGENFNPVSLNADPAGLDNNDRVDINASGAVAGTVLLPDVTFIQNSLNDLPESLINTEDLIANSCVIRNADGSSSFVITGSEGLPNRPGDIVSSEYPTGEVQAVPHESSEQDGSWQIGDPIIEPQGVYQLPTGELVMSHEC